MKIRHVKVPEGINVSRHRPLADLFVLTAGAVALFAFVGMVALLIGSYAGRYIPVSWENAMAAAIFETGGTAEPQPADVTGLRAEAALQALADKLAANMELPEGLRITVHYLDDPEINAFATLGGHVIVLRGLIHRMPDENALAMVLGHEIAHAANRDVMANLGGTLLLQLALATLTGMSPETAEGLVWGPNALLLRRFGRDAERRADRDGLAAVAATYGHVSGADAFFRTLLEEMGKTVPEEGPEFLSTHPLTAGRIEDLAALATAQGWATGGDPTPLPEALRNLGGGP